jgi:hypothetical protein
VRYYLAKQYRWQIEQLSHHIGSHAKAWLKEADQILEGSKKEAALQHQG